MFEKEWIYLSIQVKILIHYASFFGLESKRIHIWQRFPQPWFLPGLIWARSPSLLLGLLHLFPDNLGSLDHVRPRHLLPRPLPVPLRLQRGAPRLAGGGSGLRADDLLSCLLKEDAVKDPKIWRCVIWNESEFSKAWNEVMEWPELCRELGAQGVAKWHFSIVVSDILAWELHRRSCPPWVHSSPRTP